jgi:uncharacterized protein YcbX
MDRHAERIGERRVQRRIEPLGHDLVKPCERCVVTTVDQETGEAHGDQPLAVLRQMRLHPILRKPMFGQNAVPRLGTGETATLKVGARADLVGSART